MKFLIEAHFHHSKFSKEQNHKYNSSRKSLICPQVFNQYLPTPSAPRTTSADSFQCRGAVTPPSAPHLISRYFIISSHCNESVYAFESDSSVQKSHITHEWFIKKAFNRNFFLSFFFTFWAIFITVSWPKMFFEALKSGDDLIWCVWFFSFVTLLL